MAVPLASTAAFAALRAIRGDTVLLVRAALARLVRLWLVRVLVAATGPAFETVGVIGLLASVCHGCPFPSQRSCCRPWLVVFCLVLPEEPCSPVLKSLVAGRWSLCAAA